MSAIAQLPTAQQYADLAVYFSSLPGLPENRGERPPRPHSSYRNPDPVQRLIYAGDPKRGIAACASCHGPGGYRIGAPALTKQNELYIEQQLLAFAENARANDMDMPMRTIAGKLTGSEMHGLAQVYANEGNQRTVRAALAVNVQEVANTARAEPDHAAGNRGPGNKPSRMKSRIPIFLLQPITATSRQSGIPSI
jgi:cytochrome c553